MCVACSQNMRKLLKNHLHSAHFLKSSKFCGMLLSIKWVLKGYKSFVTQLTRKIYTTQRVQDIWSMWHKLRNQVLCNVFSIEVHC